MAEEKAVYGDKVFTGVGRCIWPNVASVDESKYGGGLYNITYLCPKSEAKTALAALREECVKVQKKAFPNVLAKDVDWPWRDGDEVADKRVGHAGMYYLKAKAYPTRRDGKPNDPPQAIGLDGRSKIDPQTIYGGCFVRVCVTPKSYKVIDQVTFLHPDGRKETKNETKYGVSLLLVAVQFVGDGEKLGSDRGVSFEAAPGYSAETASAVDDFTPNTGADIDEEMPF